MIGDGDGDGDVAVGARSKVTFVERGEGGDVWLEMEWNGMFFFVQIELWGGRERERGGVRQFVSGYTECVSSVV